ncbi:MAG TPA: hypothetical protein DCP96_01370 [Lachnospiraceae bacterium]|jgi:hypothetical protein|nr:hypothetical protein [Lachnospiraceae bacterium]HAN50332.1 hypothetical protein [Lachnospiraceae bacterium]HBE07693.1 hypothetical protein [Lachnospiraceae bacterium]
MNEKKQHSVALSILLIAVCLLSFLWVSRVATDNAIFTQMNKTIDNKEQNVMALSAGTMGMSVAITLIPGDTGTTLAEKLSDMSGYMFLVLIGLYIEKILLLLSGTIAFRVLIPIGCIFCLYHLFFDRGFAWRLGVKMIVFGIAVFALVPTSVWVTQKIDNSSNVSVEQRVEESSKKAEQIAKKAKKETSKNILDKIGNAITTGMDNTINSAKTYFKNTMDIVAAMVVTSFVIPVLTLLILLFLFKSIWGIQIDVKPVKVSEQIRNLKNKKAVEMPTIETKQVVNTPNNQS